jgi:hypothetical protein
MAERDHGPAMRRDVIQLHPGVHPQKLWKYLKDTFQMEGSLSLAYRKNRGKKS